MPENTAGSPAAPAADAPQKTEQDIWNELAAERAADVPDYSIAPPAPAAAPAPEPVAAPEVQPELKEILEKIGSFESIIGKLSHEVSSSSGRVAAIQREMAVAQAAGNVVGRAPNQQAVKAAAKSTEKWDQLKNEFPDWAAAIEERVGAQEPPAQAAVDLSGIQAQLQSEIGALRQAVILGTEEAKIYGAYRNWKTEVTTPKFKDWFATQPAGVKALADSTNAEDVIRVLDSWETHKGDSKRDVTAERQARLAAAVSTPRRPAAPAPVSDAEKSADQIWEEEKQRRLARRAQQR